MTRTPRRRPATGGLARFVRGALLAAAALAVCATPAAARAGDAAANFPAAADFPSQDVRVSTDGSTSGVLRVRFENLSRVLRAQPLQWPATFMLAGVPSQTPSVRVTGGRFLLVRDGRIAAESASVPVSGGTDGGAPVQLFRVSSSGQFRRHHVYGVTLNREFAAPQGHTHGYWLVDFVDAEFDIGPPPPATGAAPESSFDPLVSPVILNPGIDPAYLLPPPKDEWKAVRDWVDLVNTGLRHGPVRKLTVYEPGVYALDPERLGLPDDPAARDTTAWRLFRRGREVPLLADAATSPAAAMFLATDFDVEVGGPDAYWLFAGGTGGGDAPLRLRRHRPGAEADDADTTVVREAPHTVRRQVREDYNNRIRPSGDASRWVWKNVSDGEIAALDLPLPSSYPADAATTGQLRVSLSFAGPMTVMPTGELIVNGRSITQSAMQGSHGPLKFDVRGDAFRPGHNDVGLRIRYPDGAGQRSDAHIHRLTYAWTQAPTLQADAPSVFTLDPLSTRPAVIHVAAPEGGGGCAPVIFAMGREDGVVLEPAAGRVDGRLRFADPGGNPATYWLVTPAMLPAPRAEAVRTMDLLRGDLHADYLAVAHHTLLPALRPLLEHRAAEGHTVAAADVDTVFDHFGHGVRDPHALKSFLSYAFHNWPAPALQRVVLVGEASDYKADPALLPPGGQADLVPVFGNPRSDAPHGDHNYSTVAGRDPLSDIAVGRISVATADELSSAIAKIIAYEANPSTTWTLEGKFVMDDNDEFPRVVDNVIQRAGTPFSSVVRFRQSDYSYEPNIKVSARRRTREGTRELLRAWNEGMGTMTFFGHGGPNLWTHERLFHLAVEMPQLSNAPRLPLLTCASCDNAWLDYPVPPVTVSMGELFLKKPEGGAIGVFAPVAGASPFEHQTLVAHLMDGLHRRGVRAQGDLVLHAKNYYFAETMSSGLPDQYVLVGDPATRLRIPQAHGGLVVSPRSVPAGRTCTVALALETTQPVDGAAVVFIRSLQTGEEMATQAVELVEGTLRTQVAVNLPQGDYAAVLHTRDLPEPLVLAARFRAEPPLPAVDAPLVNPVVTEDGATTAAVRVFNPTGMTLRDIRITATAPRAADATTTPRVLFDDVVTMEPGQATTWRMRWDAGLGPDLRVRTMTADRGLSTTAMMAPLVRHDPESTPPVHVPAALVRMTPDPLSDVEPPVVRARVFNTSDTLLRNMVATLHHAGAAVSDPVTVTDIPGQDSREVTLVARSPLPAGRTELQVRVRPADADTTPAERLAAPGTTHTLAVDVLPGPDLEFVPESVRVSGANDRLVAQNTVFIRAELRNNGGVPVTGANLSLLQDDPVSGREMQTINDSVQWPVERVEPGETVPVLFRWENARNAGPQRVWLVVNRNKSVRETNHDNNTIAVPEFEVLPLVNYSLAGFTVSPAVGREGTSVSLRAEALNSGAYADGPVDLDIGFQNPLGGNPRRVRHVFPRLEPGTPAAFETTLPLNARAPVAFATINASREVEELDAGDNTLQKPLQVIRPLADVPCSGDVFTFATILPDCTVRNMQLLPGGGMRPDDRYGHTVAFLPFETEWVIEAPVPDTTSTDVHNDGAWITLPWRLEASRDEQTSPVVIAVPVPEEGRGVPLRLHAVVQFSANYRGGRVGAFDAAIGDALDRGDAAASRFSRFDVPASLTGDSDQRVLIDSRTWTTSTVELAIRQPAGVGVVIVGFEYRLAAGLAESPLFEVPEERHDRPARLRAEGYFPAGSSVRLAWRCGRWQGDDAIEWTDWSPYHHGAAGIPALGDLVQWKVLAAPASDKASMPVISNVEFVVK